MPWDNLMIQFIVILLILLTLAIGAAYYAPNLAGSGYIGDAEGQLITDRSPNPSNTAGRASLVGGSAGKYPIQSSIACNDGTDNDNDGLIDLEDPECKNSWDTSESIF